MKTLRRLLPALLLAALVVPAVHAQTSPNCPYVYLCVTTTPSLGNQAAAGGDFGSVGINGISATNGSIAIGGYAGYGTDPTQNTNGTQVGYLGHAQFTNSSAFGALSSTGDVNTTAIGALAFAGDPTNSGTFLGIGATAVGYSARATSAYATATGTLANASGASSLAGGYQANASGYSSISVGPGSTASADYTLTLGSAASATALNAMAFGQSAQSAAQGGMAFGLGANLSSTATNSVGFSPLNGPNVLNPLQGQVTRAGVFDVGGRQISSVANGTQPLDAVNVQQLDAAIAGIPAGGSAPVWLASTDTTTAAQALGQEGTSVGAGGQAGNANTAFNTTVGTNAQAGVTGSAQAGTGGQSTAVGAESKANALASEAFGYQAQATAAFSTAIGNYSLADQANTVSFGNATTGTTRRLVNIADGIGNTDAMTVGQGQQLANVFGGGSSFLGGVMTAPSYILTSPYAAGTYNNVGSALTALDNGQNALWGAINNLPTGGGSPGPVGPTGPTGPAGSNATVTAGSNITVTQNAQGQDVVSTNPNMSLTSVTTTDGKGNTTVTSGNGVSITSASGGNVSLTANGLNNGGNVISNVGPGQVSATSTDAVNGSQLYQAQQQAQDWAKSYTDQKFSQATRQANAAGATASAIGMLALGAQGIEQHDRLVMSTAVYNGSGAIGFGYNHVSESGRVTIAIGGAFGQHGGAIGASVGIGLGN